MPRQTLFIHVGLPKTGTTSMQVFCATHRAWLAEQGICYPATMRPPHPTASQHRYLYAAIQNGNGGDHALNMVAQEIERSDLPRALISEEQFSYNSAEMAPVLARLRDRFECKIVLCLRRPDIWVESMFAQAVRGGYRPDFATFLAQPATQDRCDHAALVATWQRSFGAGNVISLEYSEQAGSSIAQLCALFDLKNPPQSPQMNRSLPGEAIAFLHGLSLPETGVSAFNARHAAALAELCMPKSYVGFTPSARAEFLGFDVECAAETTNMDLGPWRRIELLEALASNAGILPGCLEAARPARRILMLEDALSRLARAA